MIEGVVPVEAPWTPPPPRPTLGLHDLHVWRSPLSVDLGVLRSLTALLSAEERAQAAAFRAESHRVAFVTARGVLRMVLGAYVDQRPIALRLARAANGKPFVLDTPNIRFNVSHSGDIGLYSITLGREVGVDVERVVDIDLMRIARRFFSRGEYDGLQRVPESLRPLAFYACWTRKEAFVKGTGDGLRRKLDAFDVTVEPWLPARLLAVRGMPGEAQRWSLRSIDVGDGYMAAVAVRGTVENLRCWRWPGPVDCDP